LVVENYIKIIMLNKKAFTLIELLIIIAIIGILASVVLVSSNSAKRESKDAAVLTTMKSIQSAAFTCMASGRVARLGYYNVAGCSATAPNYCICWDNLMGPEMGGWPSPSYYNTKGWDRTRWCDTTISLGSFNAINYPTSCGNYSTDSSQTCGGKWNTPDFCFFAQTLAGTNPPRYFVCTEEGCKSIIGNVASAS